MNTATVRADLARRSCGTAAAPCRSMQRTVVPARSNAALSDAGSAAGGAWLRADGQFSLGFAEPTGLPRSCRERSWPTLVVTDRLARRPVCAATTPISARTRPPRGLGEVLLQSRADGLDARFTAWRGKSGRRYVATAYPLNDDEALSFDDAVLIAIAADRSVLAVRDSGPSGQLDALQGWRAEMAAAGAVEMHVHLVAATPEERQRALADLDPGTMRGA